jgi:hypothetical protein
MNHDLICSWLQLPPGNWPPDHYTLLGLDPGETDQEEIEQQVHERMETVRRYQLTHPEPATEAMNRLAQALICLTDLEAKKTYDAALFSKPANPEPKKVSDAALVPKPSVTPVPAQTIAVSTTDLIQRFPWLISSWNTGTAGAGISAADAQLLVKWVTAPLPPFTPTETTAPAPLRPSSGPGSEPAAPPEPDASNTTAGSSETPAPDNTTPEAARSPTRARRGLGTKRALYYRIARTRQLLWAWKLAGKYLNHPTRLVNRPSEARDLIHQMQVIRQVLQSFPPLLGEAGQPGYLVLALARQQALVPTLQTLLLSQREALARDWQAGYDLLVAHRQFLRQELRALRKRSRWKHTLRVLRTLMSDHPGTILLLLAWIALNLALPRLWSRWPEQLVCLLALLALKMAFWRYSFQPIRIPRPAPPTARARSPRPRPKTQRQANSSRT